VNPPLIPLDGSVEVTERALSDDPSSGTSLA
jgi:hypothetical protein